MKPFASSVRAALAAALAILPACGGGGGAAAGAGFNPAAPLTAAAVSGGVTSLLSDGAPEAVVESGLVLVRGASTSALANGTATNELLLTFPMPPASGLPALFRFDDPLLGDPVVHGRFDIVVNGARDEHESVRDAEQPAGSGYLLITGLSGGAIEGSFAFRARVIGEHHGASAAEKHGGPAVGHGDEVLDVSGAFRAPMTAGAISYGRAGETVSPPTGGEASRIEVAFIHHKAAVMGVYPEPVAAGTPRVFMNDLGQEITLTEARVAVREITLMPCSDEEDPGHEDSAGDKHGEGEPGEAEMKPVGLPFEGVVDYVGKADLVARSKTFAVPNQAYCSGEVEIHPLVGSDKHGEEEGQPAFHIAGECRDGGEVRSFDAESDEERTVTLHFHLPGGHGAPEAPIIPSEEDFARAEDGDSVQDLVVGTSYNVLLNGVDCMTATEEALVAHFAERLAGETPVMHQHGGRIDAFASF